MRKRIIAKDNSMIIVQRVEIECFRCNDTFVPRKKNYITPACHNCQTRNYFYVSAPDLMTMFFEVIGIERNEQMKQRLKKMQRKNMKLIDETRQAIDEYVQEQSVDALRGLSDDDDEIGRIMLEEIGVPIFNDFFLNVWKEYDWYADEEEEDYKKRFIEYIDL